MKRDPLAGRKLIALCMNCFEWHRFVRPAGVFLSLEGQVCECGGKRFEELRSQDTFNEFWGKETAAKMKRKAKKK